MPPTNLPAWLPPLIGREAVVDAVMPALVQTRLLTLSGPGGCGKTSLALQIGKEVTADYADGVWLVELAALPEPTFLLEAVREVLQVHDAPTQTVLGAVIAFLHSREVLLILDNCEHLLPACTDFIETLLRSCPHLHILATSREVLASPLETIWSVPPLELPPEQVVSNTHDLMAFAAVQLFCRRAQAVAPAFTLTDANAAAVAQICRQLDGIPLAIELAAACLKLLAPEQIAVRIAQSTHLLAHAPRTAPPRHQTLTATLEWSYRLLSVDEQVLFRRLCVLRGSFTIEAAEAVDDCARQPVSTRLMRLIDTSLLEVVQRRGEARYRFLEILRQFGAEALRKSGEECAIFNRYCTWLERLAASATAVSGDDEQDQQVQRLDRVEQEIEHVRGVLHWLLDSGQAERALQLATALLLFWRQRGYIGEGAQWLTSCLKEVPSDAAPLARARGLNGLGILRMWQCMYTQAQTLHEEALAIFEMVGHRTGIASSLFRLGFLADKQGNYEVATSALEQSLRIFTELSDEEGAEMARNRLGTLAFNQGEYAEAQARFEQSLRWQRLHQRTGAVASTLLNLGILSLEQHDLRQAAARLQESLTINCAIKDLLARAYALTYLGWIAVLRQNHEHADALFREALGLPDIEAASDPQILVRLLAGIASVAARQGAVGRAARLWGAAETACGTYGVRFLPFQQRFSAQVMAAVAQSIDPDTFSTAWDEGRAMALADARTYAAAPLVMAQSLKQANDYPGRLPAIKGAQSPVSEERSASPLKILGLGSVEISYAGHIVTATDLTYTKAYELLFYLLRKPACTREQIGLALWPDATPEYLRATFRVVVYHLRRALGSPHWIIRERQYYAFNRSRDYWYDVEEFETAAREARHAAPEQAVTLLERARTLYRGDFLAGLRTSDWVAQQQEELRRTYLEVLLTLGRSRAVCGEVRQALEVFFQAIDHDSYCEEAHRGIIRCYMQLNEPGQALRQYEDFQRMLESELGIRPARETRELLSGGG